MKTTKQTILEEFRERWEDDTACGGYYTELKDFLSKVLDEQREEMIKEIEGMKKNIKMKEKNGTRIKIVELPSGKIGYNRALDDIIKNIKGL